MKMALVPVLTFQGSMRVIFALIFIILSTGAVSHSSPMLQHRDLQRTAQAADAELSRLKLFEGDILLVDGDKPYGFRNKRSDIMTSSSQEAKMMEEGTDTTEYTHAWPNRTVYYEFGQRLEERYRAMFRRAMDAWEEATCIEFEHAPNPYVDHLVFIKSDSLGCSSYVGRKGGAQLVTMSDLCFKFGHAVHEIGHAIGLWHEHSRPDRDNYIDVLYDNIMELQTDNFGKLIEEKFELVPDVGYDIESIMHYGPYAFSKEDNGPPKETIRLREDAPLDYKHCTNLLAMGQRDQLSYLDRLRANRLYSCQTEIALLVAAGRECILPPTTTPTPVPTQPLTTMPDPTPSQPPIPWPTPPQRLKSGSVITLRLDDPNELFDDLDGLKCTPTCRKTNCVVWGTKSSCNRIDHRFEIIMPENPDANKIKSGAKVALRSKSNPTQWLDCSSPGGACSISSCMTRNNSSITTCNSHFFKIFGVGRQLNRLINTNHNIQLRHELNDSYFNCNTGDQCRLSECVESCEAPSLKFNIL